MADKNKNKARVNVTISPDLNKRWNAVAKKHGLKKSSMVEEFLEMVIPVLESDSTDSIVKTALQVNEDLGTKLKEVF